MGSLSSFYSVSLEVNLHCFVRMGKGQLTACVVVTAHGNKTAP